MESILDIEIPYVDDSNINKYKDLLITRKLQKVQDKKFYDISDISIYYTRFIIEKKKNILPITGKNIFKYYKYSQFKDKEKMNALFCYSHIYQSDIMNFITYREFNNSINVYKNDFMVMFYDNIGENYILEIDNDEDKETRIFNDILKSRQIIMSNNIKYKNIKYDYISKKGFKTNKDDEYKSFSNLIDNIDDIMTDDGIFISSYDFYTIEYKDLLLLIKLSQKFKSFRIERDILASSWSYIFYIICEGLAPKNKSSKKIKIDELINIIDNMHKTITSQINITRKKAIYYLDKFKDYELDYNNLNLYEQIQQNYLHELQMIIMGTNIPFPEYIALHTNDLENYIYSPSVYNSIQLIKDNDSDDILCEPFNIYPYIKKLYMTKVGIDLVSDLNEYSNSTYNNTFAKYVKREVTKKIGYPTSQAFLKLYEIIVNENIIPENQNIIKSFHICELPGQFILALSYYKTKMNKEYEWFGQSLNAKSPIVIKKYGDGIFADNYNLLKKFNEKWLFGPENTGDITDIKNINYYIKYFSNKKRNLVTADCGLSSDVFGFQESQLAKIVFSQFIVGISILQHGGTYIFKIFLPLDEPSTYIILNYIYYLFDEINYCKPSLNPASSEIYLICKGFIEKNYSLKIKNDLIKIHKDFENIKNKPKLPFSLAYNHYKIMIDFIITNEKFVKRNILMFHMKDKVDLNDIQIEYAKNWVKKYLI